MSSWSFGRPANCFILIKAGIETNGTTNFGARSPRIAFSFSSVRIDRNSASHKIAHTSAVEGAKNVADV